jgi:predicted alpha/beta superfamily hydrolase
MALILDLTTTTAPDDRPVYVAGTFTDWYPDADAFRMQPVGPGQYRFTFPEGFVFPSSPVEYKYTRGSWADVELDAFGQAPPNRPLGDPSHTYHDYVPHWRRDGLGFDPALMPRIEVFSPRFRMPQLRRRRRVTVLLPHDYDTSRRRYPVLYLHDAQNLFAGGSAYGDWAIERSLAVLALRERAGVIVVAIDHGDRRRIHEYIPYPSRLGVGEGAAYVRFLVETLKPRIDGAYRTYPDRAHTGIGGSSLGGLISLYAGLTHPDVFGRWLVFSPSLWVSRQVFSDAAGFRPPAPVRAYFYAGGREGSGLLPATERLHASLARPPVQTYLHLNPGGTHTEADWARAFPRAVEWLFFD